MTLTIPVWMLLIVGGYTLCALLVGIIMFAFVESAKEHPETVALCMFAGPFMLILMIARGIGGAIAQLIARAKNPENGGGAR